jgi:hypothetical protein
MITFPSTVLLATDGSSHGVNARLAAADITARSGASLHAGVAVVATHSREGGWPSERILHVARSVGADLLVVMPGVLALQSIRRRRAAVWASR